MQCSIERISDFQDSANMAYGLKYRFDYRSPMREKLTYQVSISERDYMGEVQMLKPIGDELKITQGQIDDNELVPTKSSELTLTLLCTEEGDPLTELFTVDPLQYMISVGVCRTTAEGYDVCMPLWNGYISTGGYSQPYAKPPYRVTIHANDGLAILQTMPYLTPEGNMHTGVKSISQHIKDIISEISAQPARVWSAYHLSVAQTVDTFDAIGISAEAIYASFGEETPTYYDVLVSLLNNFGLQLFQSYSYWMARPLSALMAKRRPEWYSDVSEGFGLGSLDRTLPLYGSADDGYGVSTSAVMSLQAPLKQVTTTAPDTTYSVQPLSAKNPELWRDGAAVNLSRPRRGLAGVIVNSYKTLYGCCVDHIFEDVLRVTPNVQLTVSAKIFNREDKETKAKFGVALVPKTFKKGQLSNNLPTVADDVYFWNAETQSWANEDKLIDVTLSVAKDKVKAKRVSKDVMDKTAADVSCRVVGIPYPNHRLAIVLSKYPTCEIYDVTLEIENDGITIEESRAPFIVSPFGHGSLEIEQSYVSASALPFTALSFQQSIVDVATGESIPGMLSLSESTSIASAIASGIQAMRGGVTRTIEGEVYMPAPIDLNTLWRDRDGRAYYTNYIVTNAKRGVYGVQLCELLPLARLEQDAVSVALPGQFMSNIIGIDNSVFYTTLTARGLYLSDVNSGKTKLVHEKRAPYFYVRKGYRCVCAIDYTQAGEAAQIACSAYDAGGALLSAAVLDSAVIQGSALSTVQGIAETISYDALCDVWYSAYWNGSELRCSIWDTSGAQLYVATVIALGTRPTSIRLVPVNNGFVVAYSTERGTFANYHNNAVHEGASVGGATIIADIKAIADKYIVLQVDGAIIVKPRNEFEVVADLADTVASFSDSEYEFVCNNQILVVLRHIRTRTLKVLDVRTLREVNVDSELFASSVWLNGEWLRTYANDKFYKQRVGDGDGYIYEELYDSNGQQLRDLEGNVLRVIKE